MTEDLHPFHVSIPRPLFIRAKLAAMEERRSLRALIVELLEARVKTRPPPHLAFPSSGRLAVGG